MASDRMMEYYYAMGQDSLHTERYEEAILYFRKAARMGALEAVDEICAIGECFELGQGVPADEEKAVMCYEAAAEFDALEAVLRLGELYLRGIGGRPANVRKAKKCLERACDMGSARAASLLGKVYDEGITGRVNASRAFQYYLLAAQRGDTASMLMTGLFYAQGLSVPKDTAIAEEWIRKGCEMGDPDGETTLRTFLAVACTEYVTGAAGRRDYEKAEAMAEEAARLGDKEAWLRLGEVYRGNGQREGRHRQAFLCFEKAAAQGLPAGQAALGLCYESGLGTLEDIEKAVRLYEKAAEAGDAFAMARLGYAYETGQGVEHDEKKAMAWLIKAAMKGDEGAILTLKEDYHYEWQ